MTRGFKFSGQKPIDGYIVDFYCAALCLVIKIDGGSHQEKAGYDVERRRILNAYGLNVVHYTNEDVLHTPNAVRQNLLQHITQLSE